MSLSSMDHLRIERAVFTVDFHVQDLPGRNRRTIRHELRANLESAAAEVGGKEAVRRLGNLRRVAADYLDAEYGVDGPRPRWLRGFAWVMAVSIITAIVTVVGAIGYFEGVLAAAPPTGGTFSWYPFAWAGPGVDVEILPGDKGWAFSVALPPWPMFIFLGVFLVAARWWRLLGPWRRRKLTAPTPTSLTPPTKEA